MESERARKGGASCRTISTIHVCIVYLDMVCIQLLDRSTNKYLLVLVSTRQSSCK
jgi:hypothetical protein